MELFLIVNDPYGTNNYRGARPSFILIISTVLKRNKYQYVGNPPCEFSTWSKRIFPPYAKLNAGDIPAINNNKPFYECHSSVCGGEKLSHDDGA